MISWPKVPLKHPSIGSSFCQRRVPPHWCCPLFHCQWRLTSRLPRQMSASHPCSSPLAREVNILTKLTIIEYVHLKVLVHPFAGFHCLGEQNEAKLIGRQLPVLILV